MTTTDNLKKKWAGSKLRLAVAGTLCALAFMGGAGAGVAFADQPHCKMRYPI